MYVFIINNIPHLLCRKSKSESVSCSVLSDSLQPHGLLAHQDPRSMEFSRQEYWSGLPFPSQGIFPTQASNPGLPYYRQILHRLSPQENPVYIISFPKGDRCLYRQRTVKNHLNSRSLQPVPHTKADIC